MLNVYKVGLTLFDKAAHVSLIIRIPGMKEGITSSMASFSAIVKKIKKIYTTLCLLKKSLYLCSPNWYIR